MRKTKIICTVGPACSNEETLTQTITSVTCEIKEEENLDYEIDLLSNNVRFL